MAAFEEYNHFFTVRMELFDGPIDLLLHLVKQRELPIEQVSLAEVSSQYFECIEAMRHVDLDIAGEYLVIAATLLSIKASVLLNKPVELVLDEDGNLVNPHDELLRRLREAEIYKEGANHLSTRSYLGIDVFNAPSALKHITAPPPEYVAHDPMLLGKAFRKLLEKLDDKGQLYTVMVDSVSVVERMMQILDIMKQAAGPVVFEKLIPDVTSRASLLGSFIALLELCKRQVIRVKQAESFDTIFVVLASTEVEVGELSSEFDEVSEAVVLDVAPELDAVVHG